MLRFCIMCLDVFLSSLEPVQSDAVGVRGHDVYGCNRPPGWLCCVKQVCRSVL